MLETSDMKKLMMAVSAAALLGASTLAALTDEATGVIASVDPATGTVTLQDGSTFLLPVQVDAASLQIGERIKIMYEEGSTTATSVEPAG
jgi:Protein of unknown function (DUF1344)